MTTDQIRVQYTRVARNQQRRWRAYLEVGNQTFAISPPTTKKSAEWFANRLADCLAKIINDNF